MNYISDLDREKIYKILENKYNSDELTDLVFFNRCYESFFENMEYDYANAKVSVEIKIKDKTIGYINGDMYNIRRMILSKYEQSDIFGIADAQSDFDIICVHDLLKRIHKGSINSLDNIFILDFVYCEDKELRDLILDNLNVILENIYNAAISYIFISTYYPESISFENDYRGYYEVDCNRENNIDESDMLRKKDYKICKEDNYAWKQFR